MCEYATGWKRVTKISNKSILVRLELLNYPSPSMLCRHTHEACEMDTNTNSRVNNIPGACSTVEKEAVQTIWNILLNKTEDHTLEIKIINECEREWMINKKTLKNTHHYSSILLLKPKHIIHIDKTLQDKNDIDFPKFVMFGQWAYVRPEHLKCWKYEVMQKEK